MDLTLFSEVLWLVLKIGVCAVVMYGLFVLFHDVFLDDDGGGR